MGLYTELPSEIQEVDVIIAGGGTAGCIVASRLTDADPGLVVLVIEGGTNNYGMPTILHPAFCFSHIFQGGNATKFYKSNSEPRLDGRELIFPAAEILGGGSSMNLMMYTRGQRSDYDAWKTPGWSADDILPYLRKFETYHGPGDQDRHGTDGPIHVSAGRYKAQTPSDDFVAAAETLSWPEHRDLQSLDSNNGVQRALRYVSPDDGKRQDVGHAYIHPRLEDGKHEGLHVLVESQVVRILFDGKRASGVEYRANPELHPNSQVRNIRARRMVVVSCGAFGTPLLLERSGIGNTLILLNAGVTPVADVPGVGQGYQDHQLLICPYKSSLSPEETLDALARQKINPGELIMRNDPLLSWNGQDITCKLRPNDSDVAELGSEFQEAWERDFKLVPSRPLALMSLLNVFPGDPTSVPDGQYFSTTSFSVYPYSRGHIHITGPSVDDPPNFANGFFSDPEGVDIKKLLWAYKAQREIVRRMKCYRGEVASSHPPFPADSAAACVDLDAAPVPAEVSPIAYSAHDDSIIEDWIRKNVTTAWHALGTCKMGPREELGVVDPSLSVHGVEGLKIADMSIAPQNVAANTQSTALAIGEKAADIFIRELGLQ
ncbi:alcohol oxidase-like protein [Xylariomycetidae sp. FL2044]|nr:alcohol oxidase-like protein [Xylariomycetidae sp. FL2044]